MVLNYPAIVHILYNYIDFVDITLHVHTDNMSNEHVKEGINRSTVAIPQPGLG